MNKMHAYGRSGAESKRGVALVVVLLLIGALVVLGAMIFSVFSIDLRSVAHFKHAVEAFQDADAGVNSVESRVRDAVIGDTLALDGRANIAVSCPAPTGFNFDTVTNLTALADGESYLYRVESRIGASRAVIEAVIGPRRGLLLGLFGDDDVNFGPNVTVYSYYSDVVTNPVPADSTSEATVGTNVEVAGRPDTVDGSVYLGEAEDGTPATCAETFPVTGGIRDVPHIDADPLGCTNGILADCFTRVAASNNNDRATGGTIAAGALRVRGDVTLPSGDYYVSEIDIRAHQTLTINATNGPVNIYLIGAGMMMPNSSFIIDPPIPGGFRIFSNSDETIQMQPNNDLSALIYAPYAEVQIQPNGDFYGCCWANELDVQPGGNIFMDVNLVQDFFIPGDVGLRMWRQVR